MPGRCCMRRVEGTPQVTYFKPAGIPMRILEEVALTLDELEAVRLADLEGLYQEQASSNMGVSRPTFSRIIESARRKIGDALVNGKALRIGGGSVVQLSRAECRRNRETAGRAGGHGGPRRIRKGTMMKVIVTAKGSAPDCETDPHFGRAKKFVLVDMISGEHSAHDNRQNLNTAQGAGIQSAETVIRLGAEAVITGNMGPKSFRVLSEAGIRIYLVPAGSTVSQAVDMMKQGRLEEVSGATQEGHWM